VDEAQNLMHKVLEEIRMMSGIETHKEKVLRIILAGQPELRETLDSPNMKQLVQRVRLRFHIGPLDSRDTRAYINHRLSVAGRDADEVFADDSFDVIYRYSGGVPRLVNTLCDSALLCAFADNKPVVGKDDIMNAVAELDWKEHESITGRFNKLREVHDGLDENGNVAKIEVRADGERLLEQSLPPGRIIVGRSPDNEIYIKSKFVSRHHAQLISDEDGCVIEDLNSTNGVFVGEKQVKRHRLRDGDVVTLGAYELVYTDLRQREPANEAVISEVAADDDEASVVGE
jgi:hypothetical protein